MAKKKKPSPPTTAAKPRRISLRDPLYITLTILIFLALVAVLVTLELLGWFDNVVGSVLSVVMTLLACVCVFDLGMLFSACMTFGEGMVNAGKNDEGVQMVFHASEVKRLEVRDKENNVLPDGLPVYNKCEVVFVMESGRQNRRAMRRLTAEKLAAIREALQAEQARK